MNNLNRQQHVNPIMGSNIHRFGDGQGSERSGHASNSSAPYSSRETMNNLAMMEKNNNSVWGSRTYGATIMCPAMNYNTLPEKPKRHLMMGDGTSCGGSQPDLSPSVGSCRSGMTSPCNNAMNANASAPNSQDAGQTATAPSPIEVSATTAAGQTLPDIAAENVSVSANPSPITTDAGSIPSPIDSPGSDAANAGTPDSEGTNISPTTESSNPRIRKGDKLIRVEIQIEMIALTTTSYFRMHFCSITIRGILD
jgi:hypothetical protein